MESQELRVSNADTKTVERREIQQKKKAQGIYCLLLCPCACWQSLKQADYVMLTEQGNDVYCANQVTFLERV